MPNAEFQDFQAQLALLRDEVKTQLEAHRLEVAAAIQQLSEPREAAACGDEPGTIQAHILEWERREAQIGERIATTTIEYQALRAKAELDRYRQQQQISGLETQIALREAENKKLRSVLEALMAEHAECSREPAAPPQESLQEQENLARLKAQLESSELECAQLRRSIESSLALKLARAFAWLLGPLRSLFTKRPDSPGAKS